MPLSNAKYGTNAKYGRGSDDQPENATSVPNNQPREKAEDTTTSTSDGELIREEVQVYTLAIRSCSDAKSKCEAAAIKKCVRASHPCEPIKSCDDAEKKCTKVAQKELLASYQESCTVSKDTAGKKCNKKWFESHVSTEKGTVLYGTAFGLITTGDLSGTARTIGTVGLASGAITTAFALGCRAAVKKCEELCSTEDVTKEIAEIIKKINVNSSSNDTLTVSNQNTSDFFNASFEKCKRLESVYRTAMKTAEDQSILAITGFVAASQLRDDKKSSSPPKTTPGLVTLDPEGGGPSVLRANSAFTGSNTKGEALPDVDPGNLNPENLDNTDDNENRRMAGTPSSNSPSKLSGTNLGGAPAAFPRPSSQGKKSKTSKNYESTNYWDKSGSGPGSLGGFSTRGYTPYDTDHFPLKRTASKKIASLNKKFNKNSLSPGKARSKNIFHKASRIIQKFCDEGQPCR